MKMVAHPQTFCRARFGGSCTGNNDKFTLEGSFFLVCLRPEVKDGAHLSFACRLEVSATHAWLAQIDHLFSLLSGRRNKPVESPASVVCKGE